MTRAELWLVVKQPVLPCQAKCKIYRKPIVLSNDNVTERHLSFRFEMKRQAAIREWRLGSRDGSSFRKVFLFASEADRSSLYLELSGAEGAVAIFSLQIILLKENDRGAPTRPVFPKLAGRGSLT